ncbi:MAG TPA: glycosyltransferase, partial [Anaeromyxobacteraceae bacterium]|nr:glycosyltransferase [Anaeromyxobacteraceae bacterium]
WGNGHATLWRGLARALADRGHRLEFFERDVPWYAGHRDLTELPGGALHLYRDLAEALPAARAALAGADVAMVTSYCPDALDATALVLDSPARLKVFYDLDAPVTLFRRRRGEPVEWVGPRAFADFDLVLSFTGGRTLDALRDELGARRAAPLYGSVDPEVHRPSPRRPEFEADLSYLGTWAASRQDALERLFLVPAARLPDRTFVIGGSMYGPEFPWRANVKYVRHLEPPLHASFFCSSPLTLNITRAEFAAFGHCPSGRLFEAAACGVPLLSDAWDGLDAFFRPGEEILVASTSDEAVAAVTRPREELARIGRRARERALAEHTAESRAEALVAACDAARGPPLTPNPLPPRGARGERGLEHGGSP